MSEQRTADNTPHVYKYGAPDTCKHCGNHRSHEVHTMTDQQTAATDNALVEKLTFSLRDWKVGDRLHFPSLNALTIHEAAERIKSLLAEVERLNNKLRLVLSHATGGGSHDVEASTNDICCTITRYRNRVYEGGKEAGAHEAEADRQRMREVMERCAVIVDRNLYRQHEKIEDVPKLLRAALNPASKDNNHD